MILLSSCNNSCPIWLESLRWAKKPAFKKRTRECRNMRCKNTSVSKWFLDLSEKCSEKSENNPKFCCWLRFFWARFGGMERNDFHKCVPWGLSNIMDVASGVSGMSAPSMMACFSVLLILCHLIWHRHFVVTWMEIPLHDNLQGRAWRKTWRKVQRKARRKVRRKVRRKTQWKTRWKILPQRNGYLGLITTVFISVQGALLATRFLDPFPRRSGSVAGSLSLSAQRNPLSNVMRLNVLKDCIHPILGATLIKTGTYHDMR